MRELKALGFDSYEAYLKSGLWHQFKSSYRLLDRSRCCLACGSEKRRTK
jgi:hypothetical protein